jgi:hypothetical protein
VNLHSRSARPITNEIHFVGGVLTVRYGYKPTGLTIINDDIPRTEHLGRDKISNLKLLSLLDPVECCGSGSSFPADSAKPVPLAVVSLDSR